MYIELFLLDDLLMNLLIMRLAAALLSVRPPLYRQAAAGAASAVYAALAAYLCPALGRLVFRPLPLIIMTAALPARSVKGVISAAGATLFATLVIGGAALSIALFTGGGINNGFISAGVPLRAAALAALAAAAMPRAVRKMLKRRTQNGALVKLTLVHGGIERRFAALVDTGNGLTEPATGLPVIVVRCAAFKRYAALPVMASTAGGSCTLYAFKPKRAEVDGVPVSALIAVSEAKMSCEALVPAAICPAPGGKRSDITERRRKDA